MCTSLGFDFLECVWDQHASRKHTAGQQAEERSRRKLGEVQVVQRYHQHLVFSTVIDIPMSILYLLFGSNIYSLEKVTANVTLA